MTIGYRQAMAQFGLITICVMGSPRGALTGAATIYASLGNNFAALTGAPQGDCVSVHQNAVIIANTDVSNESWEASDIGDYTNWSTGEWFSGRIYDPSGPIKASVSFGAGNYFFKKNSIHRARYVGGEVKWDTEKLFDGIGCSITNCAVAGATGILFASEVTTDTGNSPVNFYWFDGVNYPVLTNPLTSIGSASLAGPIVYNRIRDTFTVWDRSTTPVTVYIFSPRTMSWGKTTISYGATPGAIIPQEGDTRTSSNLPVAFAKSAANTITRYSATGNAAGAAYIQTAMMGRADYKTLFSRLTPIDRRQVDLGTNAVTLTVDFYHDLSDTSAASTLTSIPESTFRKRFDFTRIDNYARFKLTYTDIDTEIDDVAVEMKPAGKN